VIVPRHQPRLEAKKEETFMRSIMAIATAGVLATWIANPALAAKRHHDHNSGTAVEKTDTSEQSSPYAPGQQRYKADRKKKGKTS
jgi:hypothetical protein